MTASVADPVGEPCCGRGIRIGVCKSSWSDHLTRGPIFDGYETVRHRLPEAGQGGMCAPARDLSDIAELYDTFLLDAFGVLNVAEAAIAGPQTGLQPCRRPASGLSWWAIDVLGGQGAGGATALITSHDLLRDADPMAATADSGLRPDHVLLTT